MPLQKKLRVLSDEEWYKRWTDYLKAADKEIIHGFWNRKVFRAIRKMFISNAALQIEGGQVAWDWIREMYATSAVMLVRRDLDTRTESFTLLKLLHELEAHHDVLQRQAKGSRIPTVAEIRSDRKELERRADKVDRHSHTVIAHRTEPADRDLTFAELDEGLRAVRVVLIKYLGVLEGTDLMLATPTPQFDWLGPFRVPWATDDFEEDELEEAQPMSEEERAGRLEHFRLYGFYP
jgi:hypothetical protein